MSSGLSSHVSHHDVGIVGSRLHGQNTDWPRERKLSATRAVRSQDVTMVRMCVSTHVQIYTDPIGSGLSLLAAFTLIVGSS